MNSCSSESALLVDGTALFQASRLLSNDPLDYRVLVDSLLQGSGAQAFKPAVFYTAYAAENEGQTRFLDFIHRTLGWVIDPIHPAEAAFKPPIATLHNPDSPSASTAWYRFDARIAFALGRLAGQRAKIVVVSDSYALAAPMIETSQRNTEVTLAFFGQLLDPRYRKYLPGSRPSRRGPAAVGSISWLDLDTYIMNLFRSSSVQGNLETGGGLAGLP